MLSVTRARDRAVFRVEDNGTGIRRDLLPRLFDGLPKPPAPVTASQNPARSIGIGLSVCEAIVKAHGGAIEAENLRGGGAGFSFSLPIKQ